MLLYLISMLLYLISMLLYLISKLLCHANKVKVQWPSQIPSTIFSINRGIWRRNSKIWP